MRDGRGEVRRPVGLRLWLSGGWLVLLVLAAVDSDPAADGVPTIGVLAKVAIATGRMGVGGRVATKN